MDKNISKKLFRNEGIHTPEWIHLNSADELYIEDVERLGYPVIVKPNSGGSSLGVKIIKNKETLVDEILETFRWDNEVLIEQYIEGEEITCSILNGKLLPIIAIRSQSEFFDYSSKYDDGGADEHVIQLPPEIFERVRASAIGCYKTLKCSVYARIDMMIKDGIPYVMEVNTLPGLTKNSLDR